MKVCRPINDLVDLAEAIEAGEHSPLPPLDIEREEFDGIFRDSMEYALLTFGHKGKRQIRTGPDKTLMIEKNRFLIVNEQYRDIYCCDV